MNTSDSRKVCVEPLASKRTTYDCCENVRAAGSGVDTGGWTDTITPGYKRPSASGAQTLLPTIDRFPGRLPLAIRQYADGTNCSASADDRSRCRLRTIRSFSNNDRQRQLFQNAGDCCVFVVVVGKLGQPGLCAGQILFPSAVAELYAQRWPPPPANYITLYKREHRVYIRKNTHRCCLVM